MEDLEKIFNQTLDVVNKCGKILKNVNFDEEATVKLDGSLVTKYDLMIDEILTKRLKEILNIPILSEEHSEEISDTYFVVDPIDGTHNFSRGFECFGTMVALVEKGITIFSIIEIPLLNKTYTAIKGQGAYLNGIGIQTRNPGERFIGNTNTGTDEALTWLQKLRECKYKFEFRSLYCACVPLCYVASGNFDFSIHNGRMGYWDGIIPKLIIEEAGGVCEMKECNNGKYTVIAGSKEVVKIIKETCGIT